MEPKNLRRSFETAAVHITTAAPRCRPVAPRAQFTRPELVGEVPPAVRPAGSVSHPSVCWQAWTSSFTLHSPGHIGLPIRAPVSPGPKEVAHADACYELLSSLIDIENRCSGQGEVDHRLHHESRGTIQQASLWVAAVRLSDHQKETATTSSTTVPPVAPSTRSTLVAR